MAEKLRTLLFRIFGKDTFIGKIIDKILTREIITYLFFGLCTTAVNLISYSILIRLFPGKVAPCNAASWLLAVLFAFFTNKLFVFESKSFEAKLVAKEFSTFMASRVLTGLMETFLPSLLIKAGLDMPLFGTEGLPAKLAVGIIIIILNYLFSKLVSFRKKTEEAEEVQETDNETENRENINTYSEEE